MRYQCAMGKWVRGGLLAAGLVLLIGPAPAQSTAQEPGKKGKTSGSERFVRLTRSDDKKITGLQTSVVRYTSPKKPGVVVDLVGVVHLGEKEYYKKLNERFAKEYDAVLYELVAPKGAIPQPNAGTGNPIGFLQRGMTRLLELEFQLDAIDYTRKNFVHADLTPDEFLKAMRDRNESFWTIAMRMMKASIKQELEGKKEKVSEWDVLRALLARDRSQQLKRLMAGQLVDMESQMEAIEGPNGSTLISARNEKALKVLEEQIAGGKRRLAIFYGAGHMTDFDRRLTEKMGYRRGKTEWLTAWRIDADGK